MKMFPLLILLVIFGARMNTAYDAKLIFKRHLTINNLILSKIFISQSKINSRDKNLKVNRNKLTIVGLIFYLLIIILLIFTFLMFFVIPPIESTPFVINSRTLYIYTNNLNQKLPVVITLILLFFEISFYFFNTYKTLFKKSKSKVNIKNKHE